MNSNLIQLHHKYAIIASELRKKGLTPEQISVMKNGDNN